MSRALIDTSVVIAYGNDEEIELPDESAISTMTLCELHHGVLVASGAQVAGRVATLTFAERTFDALPVDRRVSAHYGRLMALAQSAHGARPRVSDTLIAATAISHGLALYTRDRDFERLDIPELVLV